jgi:hypothetical protein
MNSPTAVQPPLNPMIVIFIITASGEQGIEKPLKVLLD